MRTDLPLDYADFQLSPKRSRCELFVSCNGTTEKLASGLIKPFVSHLKVAEEQLAQAVQSIKLEVQRHKNAETWFTRGNFERFVQFVSTPEILELVNTFDAEMSQLEAAQRIYLQGARDQRSISSGGNGTGAIAAVDATKMELLRAIGVRLVALRQELTTAYAHAAAAGFNPESVSKLQLFADCFGAHRLNEACVKYAALCQRRPELRNSWTTAADDRAVRSSYGSDMSIDDDSSWDCPRGSHLVDQPPPSTCHPPEPSSHVATALPAQRSATASVDKDEGEGDVTATDSASSSQAGQPERRLSVQDRINLFENRQKEGSSGRGKPVVGKSVDLRRLSSDASAVEKTSVTRRWSAASDMSIDIGSDRDKYNESESPLGTPTPSSSLLSNLGSFSGLLEEKRDRKGSTETATSTANDVKTGPKDDQSHSQTRLVECLGRTEEVVSKSEVNSSMADDKQSTLGQIAPDLPPIRSFSGQTEFGGVDDQAVPQQILSVASLKKAEVQLRDQQLKNTLSRWKEDAVAAPRDYIVGGAGKEACDASLAQYKALESYGREVGNKEGRKDSPSTEKQPRSFAQKVDDSGLQNQNMKFQRQGSGSEQKMKKSIGKRENSSTVSGYSKLVSPGKMSSDCQETGGGSVLTAPAEQLQSGSQTKGNQELNDELKMKAKELEKLYAEHKRRVPSDQSLSNQRSKPTDVQTGAVATPQYKKPALEASPSQFPDKNILVTPIGSSRNADKFNASSLGKLVDDQDYGEASEHNFVGLSFSDDSRGKFYEKYMNKRDAKLREEWGLKRVEKEAKMKAMHDSLERSRAEMKEKFEGSTDRQDSRNSSGKLRTFRSQWKMKREQQPIDYLQTEEDEVLSSELLQHKLYGQDGLTREAFLEDFASRSTQIKDLKQKLPSSIPHTSAVQVPRSSVKAFNPGTGRQRTQLENPLSQSVPNFYDFTKENTKPSSGGSRTSTHSHGRNYTRSRSTSEEVQLVKEEKRWRSHSLKKLSSSPIMFKDLSSVDSDGVVLTSLKYNKEQTKRILDSKFPKIVEHEPNHFLRKGISNDPGSGISKLKAPVASDNFKYKVKATQLHCERADGMDLVKNDEVDELETSRAGDFANMDNEKPRPGTEYDRLSQFGSGKGDSVRSTSQVDSAFVVELPASVPSTFCTVESVQNSPGESPSSCSSPTHLAFSHQHETSDMDASADSPTGSPTPWNSHSLTQTEAEVSRARKKWGSAHKPIIAANSSAIQSRKDTTKGFKRLLKFGRKTQGAETMVDWISATTSEGDDDTEVGRYLVNRSAKDLRKSKMGSAYHLSGEGFNEYDIYSEHVQNSFTSIPAPPTNFKLREDHLSGSSLKAPRSFFSLSTFRSRGSDSRPR